MHPAAPDAPRPGHSANAASGSVPAPTPRPARPTVPAPGDGAAARPATGSTWDHLITLGPRVVDAGLLLGVGLLVLLDLFTAQQAGGHELRALARLSLSGSAVVAVALRRRWPVATMGSMVVVVLVGRVGRDQLAADPFGYWYPAFAPIAALGALATPVIRRQVLPVAVAAGLAGAVAVLSLTTVSNDRNELVLFAVLFGGTYVIGVGAGVYLRDLDRQQHLAAEAARVDERLDLARELHDLVAHYVTGIVVQAQAARVVADLDPVAAGAALEQIEGAGKDALGAMRRLVGSLRNDDGEVPVAPPVGLAGLDDLVGASATLGLVVDLTIDDDARHQLPGAVAASAHRIVQESLTNARRHAVDATRARVDVRLDGRSLLVTVDDDGRQPVGGHRPDRRGYGLVGMQERSQALGGTLTAGPLDPPAHGWRVQARLPLDVPDPRGTP